LEDRIVGTGVRLAHPCQDPPIGRAKACWLRGQHRRICRLPNRATVDGGNRMSIRCLRCISVERDKFATRQQRRQQLRLAALDRQSL